MSLSGREALEGEDRPSRARRIARWTSRLAPFLLVAALLAGPLIIWLLQDRQPVIEREQLPGIVVAVESGGAGEARQVSIELDDGTVVVVETEAVVEPEAEIMVTRTTAPDGTVSYTLDPAGAR